MRTIYAFIIYLLLFPACNNKTNQTTANNGGDQAGYIPVKPAVTRNIHSISSDYLIVPGKSIGKTAIDENVETLYKTLGEPDFSDAAMGKAWLVWFGKQRDEHNNRTQLDVYTTYKDTSMTSKVVKQIRTTSSAFKVNDSIHVYAALATIKRHFPDIAFVKKYKDGKREINIYDDLANGIAFDIAQAGNQQICTGITVHEPGKTVNSVYIRLQPSVNFK